MNKIINQLINQANEDFGASVALKNAGYYAHSLFWLHLVFEKLCKAIYIKTLKSETYPFTHNILRLLTDSKIDLSIEQMQFYADINMFQIHGRYPDTL